MYDVRKGCIGSAEAWHYFSVEVKAVPEMQGCRVVDM